MSPLKPMSIEHYFEVHYKLLCFLGIVNFQYSDDDNVDNYPGIYAIYSFFCISINFIGFTISETVFAYTEWGGDRDISVQFLAVTMVGIDVIQVLKTLIFMKNHKIIQKIVRVLEIDSKKYKTDEKILNSSIYFTKVLTYGFLSIGLATIVCMSIYFLIEDISRKEKIQRSNCTLHIPRVTPFTVYVPWTTDEDLPYLAGYVYCVCGILWLGTALMVGDTMIASIMAHISGQFKMVQIVVVESGTKALDILEQQLAKEIFKSTSTQLKFDREANKIDVQLENLDSSMTWTSECDEFELRKKRLMYHFTEEDFTLAMLQCLKEAIQYHQLIIEITEDLQNAYSQAFLCQTLSSFYVIGLILVQTAMDVSNITSLRFFNTLGFLISILWQLFIQTYTANEITSEAEKVATSAYACRWYSTDKRVTNLLAILLQKAQRPMVLTAGNFAAMSNRLFLSIIRSAYQIFTLITTVMTTEK